MDDSMEKTLGFTSFGTKSSRQQKKRKRDSCSSLNGSTLNDAKSLNQVIPGTELMQHKSQFEVNRTMYWKHGVLYLLRYPIDILKEANNNQQQIKNRLNDLKLWSQNSSNETIQSKLLPSSSYELLNTLLHQKLWFSQLSNQEFLEARDAANPFAAIGKNRFINRSAMKMANLDYIFEWTANYLKEVSKINANSWSFADICGGPGGFTQYLLWRLNRNSTKPQATGFGITLKHEKNDWHSILRESAMAKNFHICYGVNMTIGPGDLYQVENIHAFKKFLLEKQPNGVDLVVADGGFLDARDHENQEYVMSQLILAEVLTMFLVLRSGGDFVCKTFEISSNYMLQLIWLLRQCFEKLTIVKPITSRPASSERYVVAINRLDDIAIDHICNTLQDKLITWNTSLQNSTSSMDVNEITLFSLQYQNAVKNDEEFIRFMTSSNDTIATAQIAACEEIKRLALDKEHRLCPYPKEDDYRNCYAKCWKLL